MRRVAEREKLPPLVQIAGDQRSNVSDCLITATFPKFFHLRKVLVQGQGAVAHTLGALLHTDEKTELAGKVRAAASRVCQDRLAIPADLIRRVR